jgi:hypothetical protein
VPGQIVKQLRLRSPRIGFVVIGAAKCGTTSLHHYLSQHPGLYLPDDIGVNSETGYFLEHSDQDIKGLTNRRIRMDLGDRELFETIYAGHDGSALLGEESTDYTKRPYRTVEIDRMRRHNRRMKLIMMIRDPYDRVVSHYQHYLRRRPETMLPSFAEEIRANPMYGDISRYHFQLEPYLDRFGARRILLVRLEDLASDHAGTMSRIFGFLGVDPTVTVDPTIHNAGEYARDDRLYDIARDLLGAVIEPDRRALERSGLLPG